MSWRSSPRLILSLVACAVVLGIGFTLHQPEGAGITSPDGPGVGPEEIGGVSPAADHVEEPTETPSRLEAVERIEVRTVDESSAPVPGASILAVFPTHRLRIATTDETGRVEIGYPDTSRVVALLAEKAGFASSTVDLPLMKASMIELVLERGGGTIEGQVVLHGGAPVGEGVTVFAGEYGSFNVETREQSSRAGRGIPVLYSTKTDANGRFVIHGLRRNRVWNLLARNGIMLSPNPVAARVGDEVTIELLRVFAVAVRLSDAQGNPPVSAPILYRSGCESWWTESEVPAKQIFPESSIAAQLLGVKSRWTDPANRWEKLYIYTTAEAMGSFGPIRVRYCIPGYHPVERKLWALPWSEAGPSEERVFVEPRTSQWSMLTIEFRGHQSPVGEEVHTSRLPIMTLHLKHTQLDEIYNIAVHHLDSPLVFEAISSGTYLLKAKIGTGAPAFSGDSQWVSVENPTSQCTVDTFQLGWLRVRALLSDGSEYSGPLHLRMLQEDGSFVYRQDFFDEAPYHVAVLDPGSYRVEIGSSPSLFPADTPNGQIVIEPGLVVELTLR